MYWKKVRSLMTLFHLWVLFVDNIDSQWPLMYEGILILISFSFLPNFRGTLSFLCIPSISCINESEIRYCTKIMRETHGFTVKTIQNTPVFRTCHNDCISDSGSITFMEFPTRQKTLEFYSISCFYSVKSFHLWNLQSLSYFCFIATLCIFLSFAVHSLRYNW